jgi:hypothetical protein
LKKKRRAGYELKPARQAKRKEADATGPQGGYGIRLALSYIRAKGMPKENLVSLFYFLAGFKKGFVLKKHIILNSYKWKTIR